MTQSPLSFPPMRKVVEKEEHTKRPIERPLLASHLQQLHKLLHARLLSPSSVLKTIFFYSLIEFE